MTRYHSIPFWLKLLYTFFVAIMVPYYWRAYGLQNFLYFCDVAVLVTLVGVWIENSLLFSMQAVGILVPQALWLIDFIAQLCGLRGLGLTAYMFDPQYPLFVRGLSLFHGWMPILLLWLVHRLGYDRRALLYQTIVGISLLLICYLGFAAPGARGSLRPIANINYVYGTSETATQTVMPAQLWLAMVMVVIPVAIYLPTHWILKTTMPRVEDQVERAAGRESTRS